MTCTHKQTPSFVRFCPENVNIHIRIPFSQSCAITMLTINNACLIRSIHYHYIISKTNHCHKSGHRLQICRCAGVSAMVSFSKVVLKLWYAYHQYAMRYQVVRRGFKNKLKKLRLKTVLSKYYYEWKYIYHEIMFSLAV